MSEAKFTKVFLKSADSKVVGTITDDSPLSCTRRVSKARHEVEQVTARDTSMISPVISPGQGQSRQAHGWVSPLDQLTPELCMADLTDNY
jgi:hypothetical protein